MMKQLLRDISPFNARTEMPTALLILKKLLAFCLCYLAGALVAEGAIILLHFAFGKNMLVGDVFDAQTMLLLTCYGYIAMSGAALLYWRVVEKRPLSEMGLTGHPGSYLIGAAMGVLLLAVSVAAIMVTGSIEYHGVFEHVDIPVILLFTGGFIVQGGTEELLCRGLVFHSLKASTSTAIAMDISTLLFILPHLSSLLDGEVIYGVLGILDLLLISTIFSLLTIRFQSIWAACGLHASWNAALYSILGSNLSGNAGAAAAVFDMRSVGETIWNGGAYGIEASIITAAVLALAAALLWRSGGRGPAGAGKKR